jgi:BirA family biotin operon repressor/biotin-[acetyl-CoA-carboxylase] ligase
MLEGLEKFARAGFAPFTDDWSRLDSLRDARVTVLRHDGALEGIARGTDSDGALRIETAAGVLERVHAGEVSLRRASPEGQANP